MTGSSEQPLKARLLHSGRSPAVQGSFGVPRLNPDGYTFLIGFVETDVDVPSLRGITHWPDIAAIHHYGFTSSHPRRS